LKKFIYSKKLYDERPQMKGWTVRVILKNDSFCLEDIFHFNIYYMSPKKSLRATFWGGGRFESFYKNIELDARLD